MESFAARGIEDVQFESCPNLLSSETAQLRARLPSWHGSARMDAHTTGGESIARPLGTSWSGSKLVGLPMKGRDGSGGILAGKKGKIGKQQLHETDWL